jgi:hypothetical protein
MRNCAPLAAIGQHRQLPAYAKRTRKQLIAGSKKRRAKAAVLSE